MQKSTSMIPDCVIGFPDSQNESFLEEATRFIGCILMEGVIIMFLHVTLLGRGTIVQ